MQGLGKSPDDESSPSAPLSKRPKLSLEAEPKSLWSCHSNCSDAVFEGKRYGTFNGRGCVCEEL
ncbi:sorting nexin-24-like protein [Corchorus olitorius]|uniref:Sorting nexin-24-like protein n=1 Tax=Corchorus olitorius TaxID=93759 RepID=A0A1R3HF37_9ROSI|nr:sorting nexin-24-like protein [Corchorus olitorius]